MHGRQNLVHGAVAQKRIQSKCDILDEGLAGGNKLERMQCLEAKGELKTLLVEPMRISTHTLAIEIDIASLIK